MSSDETVSDYDAIVQLSIAVDDACAELDAARTKYLQKSGWARTSDTPGCFWMWMKTLPDGRVLLVEESFAIRLQNQMLPDQESDDVE